MKKSVIFLSSLILSFSCIYADDIPEIMEYSAEVNEEVAENDIDENFSISEELAKADLADEIESRQWNGTVEISDENELPQGIFAIVKGYYPGDSLTIENTKTHNKAEILIIGTFPQEEIRAIKLTPEAASELDLNVQDCDSANIVIEPRQNVSGIREASFAKISFESEEIDETADSEIYAPIEIAPAEPENAVEVEEETIIENENVEVFEEPSPVVFEEEETFENDVDEDLFEPEQSETSDAVENTIIVDENEAITEETEVVVEEKAAVNEPVVPVIEKNFRDNIVSEVSLKPGYYVQISFLKDEGNLQRFTNRYGKKYRLYYLQYKNGFKVITGRFNPSSWRVEFEKIKKDFPDAFVKIIK